MNRAERRWLLVYGGFLALVTTAPYVLAFQTEGTDWVFSGFLIGVQDGNSYLAKMLQGSMGDWLFRTPYALIPQRGVLVFVPYLLLGKLAAAPGLHEQLVALFHLFRVAGTMVAVYGTYAFVSRYLGAIAARRWATTVATVGGGLGWLMPLLDGGASGLPLEYISPETFGFLAFLSLPHLALARGLLLLALLAYLRALHSDGRFLVGPILWLATFLANPISGAVGGTLIAVHQLARLLRTARKRDWSEWWRGVQVSVLMLSLAIPYGLYLLITWQQDAFLQGWAEQNLILSPPLGYYLLAYGLLLPPAVVGGRQMLSAGWKSDSLPLFWVLLLPALAYAPLGIQRRLVEGGWVGLSLLAALGLQRIASAGRRRWARAGLLGLSLPAAALLLFGTSQMAAEPAPPAFIPASQAHAFRFLGERASSGQRALAAYDTANALPAWAPVRVPIGHGPESVNLTTYQEKVRRFYVGEGEQVREQIATELSVTWVFYGPAERALAGGGALDAESAELVGEWGPHALYRWVGSP